MSTNVASVREASKLIPAGHSADFLGVLCSAGCAIHCAATPVLLSILPSVTSLSLLTNPLFHQTVALLCAVVVVRAVIPAWSKQRSLAVVFLAVAGLAAVFLDAFFLADDCCEFRPESTLALNTVSADTASHIAESGLQGNARLLVTERQMLPSDPAPVLSIVGQQASAWLVAAKPYLSPLGGLLLIVAHILNIRLKCCLESNACKPSTDRESEVT